MIIIPRDVAETIDKIKPPVIIPEIPNKASEQKTKNLGKPIQFTKILEK